jgi:hypothetical protein
MNKVFIALGLIFPARSSVHWNPLRHALHEKRRVGLIWLWHGVFEQAIYRCLIHCCLIR